jgi:hypothetical protein
MEQDGDRMEENPEDSVRDLKDGCDLVRLRRRIDTPSQ